MAQLRILDAEAWVDFGRNARGDGDRGDVVMPVERVLQRPERRHGGRCARSHAPGRGGMLYRAFEAGASMPRWPISPDRLKSAAIDEYPRTAR